MGEPIDGHGRAARVTAELKRKALAISAGVIPAARQSATDIGKGSMGFSDG